MQQTIKVKYTRQELEKTPLPQLKELARLRGVTPKEGKLSLKATWVNALARFFDSGYKGEQLSLPLEPAAFQPSPGFPPSPAPVPEKDREADEDASSERNVVAGEHNSGSSIDNSGSSIDNSGSSIDNSGSSIDSEFPLGAWVRVKPEVRIKVDPRGAGEVVAHNSYSRLIEIQFEHGDILSYHPSDLELVSPPAKADFIWAVRGVRVVVVAPGDDWQGYAGILLAPENALSRGRFDHLCDSRGEYPDSELWWVLIDSCASSGQKHLYPLDRLKPEYELEVDSQIELSPTEKLPALLAGGTVGLRRAPGFSIGQFMEFDSEGFAKVLCNDGMEPRVEEGVGAGDVASESPAEDGDDSYEGYEPESLYWPESQSAETEPPDNKELAQREILRQLGFSETPALRSPDVVVKKAGGWKLGYSLSALDSSYAVLDAESATGAVFSLCLEKESGELVTAVKQKIAAVRQALSAIKSSSGNLPERLSQSVPQSNRHPWDFYQSPAWYALITIQELPLSGVVLEPCVGDGAIASVLRAAGLTVLTNDLNPALTADFHFDAAGGWEGVPQIDWVVTNPPFDKAFPILEKAYSCARFGVAMFLRQSFTAPTKARGKWLSEHPPSAQIDLPRFKFRRGKNGAWATDLSTISLFVWLKQPVPGLAPRKIFTREQIPLFYDSPVAAPSMKDVILMATALRTGQGDGSAIAPCQIVEAKSVKNFAVVSPIEVEMSDSVDRKGMILSFSHTVEGILSGRKTVTRRNWSAAYAQKWLCHWDSGRHIHQAWDKIPFAGGKFLRSIRLTCRPYQERLSDMPASDLEKECLPGFSSKEEFLAHPLFKGCDLVWVVRFEVLKEIAQAESPMQSCAALSSALPSTVAITPSTTKRPRVLDLFCGQGGAGAGYHRAGYETLGVDCKPQPKYPFAFIQADALEFLVEHWHEFDLIHASPPCQAFSSLRFLWGKTYPNLLEPTLDFLRQCGKPYIVENVETARKIMRNPVVLCGEQFGLRTERHYLYRHRAFECGGFVPDLLLHRPHPGRMTKQGRPPVEGEALSPTGNFSGVEEARKLMECPWMSQKGLSQAIPPAFTEWLGRQAADKLGWKLHLFPRREVASISEIDEVKPLPAGSDFVQPTTPKNSRPQYFIGCPSPSLAQKLLRQDEAAAVGLMLSVLRLADRKSFLSSDSATPWLLDSGAFTQISAHGRFLLSPEDYANNICRWHQQPGGRLLAAVSQDWMCEPHALAATGLSVAEHQSLTIERFDCLQRILRARDNSPYLMPVLQGWQVGDYRTHLEQYGDRLPPGAWVGVGSVCRRGKGAEVIAIARAIKASRPDLRLHGFGVKLDVVRRAPELFYSCDSCSWSLAARFRPHESEESLAHEYQLKMAQLNPRPLPKTAGAGNGQGRHRKWSEPTIPVRLPQKFANGRSLGDLIAIAHDWDKIG